MEYDLFEECPMNKTKFYYNKAIIDNHSSCSNLI